jgi:hypothetical protein
MEHLIGVDPEPFEKMAGRHWERLEVWESHLALAWEEVDAWKKRELVS